MCKKGNHHNIVAGLKKSMNYDVLNKTAFNKMLHSDTVLRDKSYKERHCVWSTL